MKKLLILSAFLLLSACGDSPAEHQAKARSAYAAHDYQTARIHITGALEAEPNNRELLLLQARTQLALGDGEGAGATLERLAGNAPATGELAELSAEAALLRNVPDVALAMLGDSKTAEAERLRGLAAIQKRDLGKAGSHFAASLKAGGNPRLFADYARYHLITGNAAGAKDMLARAVKAAPDAIDTLLLTGQMALRDGDLARALTGFDRASNLYPASLAALSGKAAVLGDLGRTADMDGVLAQAAKLAPGDPTVAYLSARSAQGRKDWARVRDIMQPLEAKLPRAHPGRLIYGEALLRLGQHAQAEAQLRQLAEAPGGNRLAMRMLAEAQMAGGNAKGAADTLRPVADHPTASADELGLMAKALKQAGDVKRAEAYLARARFPSPQAVIQDLSEGDAAIRAGNWAKAIVAYDRVLAVSKDGNALILNNMAYSQFMAGNIDKARSFAERALQKAPNNPSVMDTTGWILFKSGANRAEAMRLLRAAAQKAPQNENIRAHLAEAERAPG